jgi:hypothetical protein
LILEWFPIGRRLKYGVLWLMLGIPGVWWVDLQVDGVKRGYVKTSITVEAWRRSDSSHTRRLNARSRC